MKKGDRPSWVLHDHEAKRAGHHYDLRIGDQREGLRSWAIPKARLPEKAGESLLAVEQPVHSFSYGSFEGELTEGRGRGTVKRPRHGQAVVLEAEPDRLRFAVLDKRHPQHFLLTKKKAPGKKGQQDWYLTNVTPAKAALAEKYGKQKQRTTDDPLRLAEQGYSASPKVDGAAILAKLAKDRIRVESVRPSSTGRPIEHTWRVPGLERSTLPPQLQGRVLRGELYGTRRGKAIKPQELGALLNMAVDKSREEQKKRGIDLKVALYALAGKEDMSRKRARNLFRLLEGVTGGKMHPLPEVSTKEAVEAMLRQIREGRNPLTEEGIVLYPPEGGRPYKHKLWNEYDVYVRDVFPAETKSGDKRAGGFTYSLTPAGPVVGRVGSGLDRSTAKEMLENAEQWKGRKARIKALSQFESGALRAPVFLGEHLG